MLPLIADKENVGIAVRTIREFFIQKQKIKQELRSNFKFICSFTQIYNEKVYDLLNFNVKKLKIKGLNYVSKVNELKIRQNQAEQFLVEGLVTYECYTAQEAIALYH
jgi:hypothetical protein